MRRLCFCVEVPFEQRDVDRFGVALWHAKGVAVDVLDLTRLLHPHLPESPCPATLGDSVGIHRAHSIGDVEDLFESLRPFCAVLMMGYDINSLCFYQVLHKLKIPYAQFCANVIPNPTVTTSFVRRLWNGRRSLMPKGVWQRGCRWMLRYGPNSLFGVDAPAFLLVGGRRRPHNHPQVDRRTRQIEAHALDYDQYMVLRDKAATPAGNNAVFLDEYGPFHPDYELLMGNRFRVAADKYYGDLIRFFNQVEQASGLSVIVAAHPCSDYESKPDCFNGRRVVKGQTASLIAGARLVLAHSSTSVGFAVLFRKPVAFITTAELAKTYYGPLVPRFAQLLGRKVLSIDSLSGDGWQRDLFSVDEARYREYAADYIKVPGSPEKMFWDIVAEALERERP